MERRRRRHGDRCAHGFRIRQRPNADLHDATPGISSCGTSDGAVIRLTLDGTTPAAAGVPVTVTLPAELAWADGSTGSRTFTTDTRGQVLLSGANGIRSLGTPGSYDITATSTVLSDTATLSVTSATGGEVYWSVGQAPTVAPGFINIEELAVGGAYVYAMNDEKEWLWYPFGVAVSQITGTPGNTVDKIYTNEAGNFGWAISEPVSC